MKRIFLLNGSPRPSGNTSFLADAFLKGAEKNKSVSTSVHTHDLNISDCNGCLRCNLIKRCSISNDDWPEISQNILDSDILVFASPVYFHHFPASVKAVLDRFRSFVKVTITEESIDHQPWGEWDKDIVLLLTMGSSDNADAQPIIDLFEYMQKMLGAKNRLHIITATRLAVIRQVSMQKDELQKLYTKLELPDQLVTGDVIKNEKILKECFTLGERLTK